MACYSLNFWIHVYIIGDNLMHCKQIDNISAISSKVIFNYTIYVIISETFGKM